MDEGARYERRGVSPDKPDVHEAIAAEDPGLFPGAFCKAVPDALGGSPEHCVVLHADGAGTKSALAYLAYREHGDAGVFRGVAQDSLVMNLDDVLCVGATGPFVMSNAIGRNARLVDKAVLRELVDGYAAVRERLRPYGIEIVSCGGETADVGDLVRTVIVDSTLAVRMRRDEFIDCANVQPGHVIIGLASAGRAVYEDADNSGIGSNGFTAARHDVLAKRYREDFPETYAPEIAPLAYTGRFALGDPLPGAEMTIGEALLSPTRTYAPILLLVLAKHREKISAIFHNTGGGLTKCVRFGGEHVRYEKTALPQPPPVFRFIQDVSELRTAEMARTFNMGILMEIVCDRAAAAEIVRIAGSFGVEAAVIGHVAQAQAGKPRLRIALGGEELAFPSPAG
jgi:phosphoribosylformylglycinamidine cyclo-ligase